MILLTINEHFSMNSSNTYTCNVFNAFQGLVVNDVHKLLTQMTDLLQTMQRTLPLGIKPPETEEGVLGK